MKCLRSISVLLFVFAVCSLSGCAAIQKHPNNSIRPPISEANAKLAFNFIRTLYHPDQSNHRIIVDPDADDYGKGTLLKEIRTELTSRLVSLRDAPRDTLRIRIESGDSSPMTQDLIVDYHLSDGRIDMLLVNDAKNPDIDMDIRHWPDGTRLICLTFWLGDMKEDIFRLYKNERVYRFVSSTYPCILQ